MDDDFRFNSVNANYFFLIPTLLNIYASEEDIIVQKDKNSIITKILGNFSKNNSVIIFAITIFILIASVRGITKLEVENSFINYFDKDTEIYRGMKKIDDNLGGTTPLDVIIKFPSKKIEKKKKMMMNLQSGMKNRKMKINQNIGLLEIKWIKLSKCMTI